MVQKKRVLNYPDYELQCPLCGEFFRTPQGLQGHQRLVHAADMKEGPSPDFPGTQSVTALRRDVEQLKLQVQKRRLQSELPPAGIKPLDLMEGSGLGGFDAEVRGAIQRRALGIDQKPRETWLDKLLANPEGLKAAIDGVRGILGVNRHDDNLSSLLTSLGLNLKDLIMQASSPKATGDLTIGGVSLQGAVLTPDLFKAILVYRAAEEEAKAKVKVAEGNREMAADFVKRIGAAVAKALNEAEASAEPTLSNRFFGVPPEPEPEVTDVIKCDVCGCENPVPAGIQPGMTVHCQGPNCQQFWLFEDTKASQKQRRTIKRELKVEPPEPIIIGCPKCGQALDVTDKALGSEVSCPICREPIVITSDTEPLPADKPLEAWQKRQRGLGE